MNSASPHDRMDSARPSIRDLNRDEQRFVIRTFLLAIGADQGLTRLAHVKREVRYEDVLKVLNVSTWPTAEATQVELAWMSEPLCHPDFPRLQTYSVFWSSSSALELWVGTTPRKPIQQSSFLTGATLLSTIIPVIAQLFVYRSLSDRQPPAAPNPSAPAPPRSRPPVRIHNHCAAHPALRIFANPLLIVPLVNFSSSAKTAGK